MKTQTFSLNTKEEIIQKKFKKCCEKALLNAIIKYNFKLVDEMLKIYLSSALLAKTVTKHLLNFFPKTQYYLITEKNNKYIFTVINLSSNIMEILHGLGVYDENNNLIHQYEFAHHHCKRAYIAGLFIGSGSINPPTTSYYHLEISFKYQETVDFFLKLTKSYEFEFKTIKRHKKINCYIKRSTLISDFLKLMDASKAVLIFENIRIERDFVNNINRLNNLDVSNYQKILKASDEQIKIIKFLQDNNFFDELDEKTQLLGKLRLENENANLLELSQLMMDKFKIEISKPGVNHMFRKMKKIYLKNNK